MIITVIINTIFISIHFIEGAATVACDMVIIEILIMIVEQ